jgi:predicted O-methyltransferase YrrM
MYSRFQLLFKYCKYFIGASNGKGHGIHSPFVFEFVRKVLMDKKKYPAYKQVNDWRNQLINDDTVIEVIDLGAGSAVNNTLQRKVSAIAKNAAKPKKYGQLLYRLIAYYKPKNIVEIGTSLGLSTAYFSLANPDSSFTTLEGVPSIAQRAMQNFSNWGLVNVKLVQGNFDDTLTATLSKLSSVDFVFVDGNHRKEPTLRYFEQIMKFSNNNTILVFDDIHWSSEMEEAWEAIKADKRVMLSIDLFFLGIILFKTDFYQSQDFILRY